MKSFNVPFCSNCRFYYCQINYCSSYKICTNKHHMKIDSIGPEYGDPKLWNACNDCKHFMPKRKRYKIRQYLKIVLRKCRNAILKILYGDDYA